MKAAAVYAMAAASLAPNMLCWGHMELVDPPPIRSRFNQFRVETEWDMTSPLAKNGTDFPCKGFHNLEENELHPVANWAMGDVRSMVIGGQTPHNGGSCQIVVSEDWGATWKVLSSYIGQCPAGPGETVLNFTLPYDMLEGRTLVGWTWFNQIGDREMYMNCAVVNVTRARKVVRHTHPLRQRPNMFVANVGEAGNNCTTIEGKDVEIPAPGPDVHFVSIDTAPPECPKN